MKITTEYDPAQLEKTRVFVGGRALDAMRLHDVRMVGRTLGLKLGAELWYETYPQVHAAGVKEAEKQAAKETKKKK